ncbi:MAG TPA: hypothetical protein VGW35_19875 [Methylomirabilota bacterium]|nr:hypothetical protein [Methylomirabilota bacterium]
MKPPRGKQLALALGLAVGLLVTLSPGLARAAGPTPFSASGSFLATECATVPWLIDEGAVTPAGESGRFVVKNRTVSGTLDGPDITGPFLLDFGTNVPIATQSGQIHAKLTFANPQTQASGSGSSNFILGPAVVPPGFPCDGQPKVVVVLGITGSLTFTGGGVQGNGDVEGTFTVAIDPATGHIVGLVPSGLPLCDPSIQDTGECILVGFSSTQLQIQGEWHQ